MKDGAEYQIQQRGEKLHLRTTSYKAEEGSALHGGIYNRELTASLAAGAVLVAAALAAYYAGVTPALGMENWPMYAGAVVAFGAMTLLFRVYVFFEEYLDLTVDRRAGIVEVFVKGFRSRLLTRPLSEMTGVSKGLTVLAPKNDDGIAVVKTIALQHNMIIPGFGDVHTYHSVNLEFGSLDTVMVFCTENAEESDAVLEMIRKFVGGPVAKAY